MRIFILGGNKTMNLTRSLYAIKTQISLIGKRVGSMNVAGRGISTHRPAGIMAGSKLSLAAKVFDRLWLEPGTIELYANSDSVFLKLADTEKIIVSGGKVVVNEDSLSAKNVIEALVYYYMLVEKDVEIFSTFKNIIEGIENKFSVDDDVFKFCDSFYYGFASHFSEIEPLVATDAEIEAALRSGIYQFPEALKSYKKYFALPKEHESSKKTVSKKCIDFISDCKAGKYRISYSWPKEMEGFIINPSYLDTFESTEVFEEIVKKIKYHSDKILERMDMGYEGAEAIGPDALNIMLIGKPGTGKTALAYALSAATGMPVCTTAWNKHSDEDEVEGKTKIVDGKPAFVETNALIFHINGGININEEINLADPSVTMGALGQQLEYPYIIKKNGYETKVRHPLNVQIATMNVGTSGSNQLNQALQNRFKTIFILDDPTRETFINILCKATKKKKEVCEWVYKAYEQTVKYLKSPEVNEEEIVQNLSIRTCIGAIANMEEGQTPNRALINSIVGAVAAVDLEVARKLQQEIIGVLPNPTFNLE